MISNSIAQNKQRIMDDFHNTSDLIVYKFQTNSGIRAMICYIEGLIDKNLMDRDIIKPVILSLEKPENIKQIVFVSQVDEVDGMDDIVDQLPYGKVSLFFEGSSTAYTIEINQWDKRSVDEPPSETVVRGAKEGFIEDIITNKSMLRRKLRNKDLVFEDCTLGKQTRTKVSIAYINGIVNKGVLSEVRKRLGEIDIDAILESGYIEELIEDEPSALLATVSNSQKPDRVAGGILEGRVAIFTDGTPHVLIVPRLLIEGIMTSEDYYLRSYYASFLRLLRFVSMFVSVYLPGLFVALQLYHQEMIPTVLLISMAGAREGVPFPVIVEVLAMTVTLELVKESGLRLPKSIGSTVSIVGALILGQAAVQAGIVSAITIIVVSAAAISEFIVPEMVEALVIYRLLMIILGGLAGLYGITCGFIIIATEIVSMDSFGIPFYWPIAPGDFQALGKDGVTRMPLWMIKFRPSILEKRNMRRQVPPKGK